PLFDPLPVPRRLMSQETPAAKQPSGAVTEPSITLNGLSMELNQSSRFLEAAKDIHALHRLAAGALDDVVFCAHDNEPSGSRIQTPPNFNNVCADNIFRIWQRLAFEQPHKWLLAVSLRVTCANFFAERIHFCGRNEV